MNWLLLTILSSFFYAINNHIDKYLVSRLFKGGIGAAILFSAFVGIIISILILLFHPDAFKIDSISAILIIVAGSFIIFSLIPYFEALHLFDTSLVIPLFQLTPVFALFLAYLFLKETLAPFELLGSSIITFSVFLLSINIRENKIRINKQLIILMSIASLFWALNGLIYKSITKEYPYWTTQFWQYVGFFIAGVLLFITQKQYRYDFTKAIISNKWWVFLFNLTNESFSTLGKLAIDAATLMAPLALVTWISQGFQPVFVFIIGLLLTLLFPRVVKEDIRYKTLIKKCIAIIFMIVGTYLTSR